MTNRERLLHTTLLTFLFCMGIVGCDTFSEQRNFSDEASRRPEGITHTEESSEVIETDPDDWRTSPLYRGVVRVEPAYPNPITTPQQRVTLPFWITDFNSISGALTLRAYTVDGTPNFVALDRYEVTGPGSYQFDFHPSLLSSSGDLTAVEGLHRLFLFDARGQIVSYGDLRIEFTEEE